MGWECGEGGGGGGGGGEMGVEVGWDGVGWDGEGWGGVGLGVRWGGVGWMWWGGGRAERLGISTTPMIIWGFGLDVLVRRKCGRLLRQTVFCLVAMCAHWRQAHSELRS